MRTILVINDYSAEARHAAAFALNLARRTQSQILVWNTSKVTEDVVVSKYAGMADAEEMVYDQFQQPNEFLFNELASLIRSEDGYNPVIANMNTMSFTANHIVDIVTKQDIWMMVKGLPENAQQYRTFPDATTQTILNKVCCPLMLIPQNAPVKSINRIVYQADLRYCRLELVRELVRLARPFNAEVLIAHMSAKGLPDMEDSYAEDVFIREVSNNVKYENLYFNNIKERDVQKAMDVLIDVMNTDLLAMVNRKFHFEDITGLNRSNKLAEYLNIPLLIFPS